MTDNYPLFRQLAGFLFLADIAIYSPWLNTFLGRGYGERAFWNSPSAIRSAAALWALASIALLTGYQPWFAALVLFGLFRLFYIDNRWNGLFRGGGAPGFMSHYAVLYILLFETAHILGPVGLLDPDVHRLLRMDFGLVLLCSGIYKSVSGYLHGEGMEYGLANPMWGYWSGFFRKLRPTNLFLRLQDMFAASTQVLAGALILIPATEAWGAALCILMFFSLVFMVRLGRLSVLMAVIPLIFLPDLGVYGIHAWAFPWQSSSASGFYPISWLRVFHWALLAATAAFPLIKIIQYLNFYGNRSLPAPFQKVFAWITNRIPVIIWRVFTPDVTNFFIRIYSIDSALGRESTLLDEKGHYSYLSFSGLRDKWRFLQVTESITLTTIFTLLKYFQSDRGLFERRLSQYARTLRAGGAGTYRFEYVSIVKGAREFEYRPSFNFVVDTAAGTVTESKLVVGADYSAAAPHSRIRETAGYGTYQIGRKSQADKKIK